MGGEVVDNLQKTLETTLGSFLDLVGCDAGSVYTVRKNSCGEEILRFESMITRAINLCGVPDHLRALEFAIDDSSIVGKTAASRKPVLLNTISEGQVSPHVGEGRVRRWTRRPHRNRDEAAPAHRERPIEQRNRRPLVVRGEHGEEAGFGAVPEDWGE